VAGGLIGTTQLLWLKVEILSVASQFRRQGVGSRLMAIAEAEAVRRGCKYAYVDTMEYQAPSFYQALGYQIAGRLDDWDSHGHAKYFLKKTLRSNRRATANVEDADECETSRSSRPT
jgi:predicted N-acetyltransferase YhbS